MTAVPLQEPSYACYVIYIFFHSCWPQPTEIRTSIRQPGRAAEMTNRNMLMVFITFFDCKHVAAVRQNHSLYVLQTETKPQSFAVEYDMNLEGFVYLEAKGSSRRSALCIYCSSHVKKSQNMSTYRLKTT